MRLTTERSERLKARVQAAVEAGLRMRGISARRASLDVVGNDGLIRDIRAGRLPGMDRLEALFEYLGVAFHFGPQDKAPPGLAEPPAPPFERDSPERSDYVTVPWHPQAMPTPGPVAAPIAFARDWLALQGFDLPALATVTVEHEGGAGDTLALVAPRAARQGGPQLWCLRQQDRLRLAPVQFEPTATVIFASEPRGPAQILNGHDRAAIDLLGRVLWSGRCEPRD